MKPTPQQARFRSNLNRPKKKKRRVINDESIMNLPMDSSANDLANVSELLTSGTKEIQDVLKHECSLIYECKVCRGLFRSIINFVIHKRKYCVNKFSAVNHQDLSSKLKQVEALFQTNSSSHDFNNKPMRTTQPPTLSSFYQSLITKTLSSVSPDGKSVASDLLKMQSATVLLDKLETNHLPQAISDSSDISHLLKDASTAVLREDGTIATNIQSLGELYNRRMSEYSSRVPTQARDVANVAEQNSNLLPCPKCSKKCHTRTALYKHLQEVHFTLYKCDQCGKYIHSVRSVLRHLHEVHRFPKNTIEQKFRKKVIASKVVKAVPKNLYRKISSPCKVQQISVVPKSDNMSCCVKCSSLYSCMSEEDSSTLCPSCVSGPPQLHLPSPAKYLMKPPLPSPASSRSGDTASPVPRLSTEEIRNKVGIQVRMNYDKCSSPGNPIVSMIETPADDDIISLSPDNLKENAQLNGNTGDISIKTVNSDDQNISVDKRKNLDFITQKLLNKKIANCPTSPVSRSQLRNIDLDGKRKSIRQAALNCKVQLNSADIEDNVNGVEVNVEKSSTPDEKVKKEIIEPKRRTRNNSVDTSRRSSVETRRSLTARSRSNSKHRDTVDDENSKQQDTVDDKNSKLKQDIVEVDNNIKQQNTGDINKNNKQRDTGDIDKNSKRRDTAIDEPDVIEVEVDTPSNGVECREASLKRKLRTRTEKIATKKLKVDEDDEKIKLIENDKKTKVGDHVKKTNAEENNKKTKLDDKETNQGDNQKKTKIDDTIDKVNDGKTKVGENNKKTKLDDKETNQGDNQKKTKIDDTIDNKSKVNDGKTKVGENNKKTKLDDKETNQGDNQKTTKIDDTIDNKSKVTKIGENNKKIKMEDNDKTSKLDDSVAESDTMKVIRGSSESLADMSPSSNNESDRLFKSLMKDIMDVSTDTCRMCNIILPSKKLLRIHAATRHLGYFRYRCSVASCGKMYFSHADATMHARTSHTNHKEDVIRINASTLAMSAALEVQARLKDK